MRKPKTQPIKQLRHLAHAHTIPMRKLRLHRPHRHGTRKTTKRKGKRALIGQLQTQLLLQRLISIPNGNFSHAGCFCDVLLRLLLVILEASYV